MGIACGKQRRKLFAKAERVAQQVVEQFLFFGRGADAVAVGVRRPVLVKKVKAGHKGWRRPPILPVVCAAQAADLARPGLGRCADRRSRRLASSRPGRPSSHVAGQLVAQVVQRASGADGQAARPLPVRRRWLLYAGADGRSLVGVKNCAVEVKNDEIKRSHNPRMVRERRENAKRLNLWTRAVVVR